jgi:excisionase family DNA binding protein
MQLLSLQEMAKYLRVHPMTLYRHCWSGRMPSIRVGGQYKFITEWVDREINKNMGLPEGTVREDRTEETN